MNKERAREELRDRKILAEIEYNQSEDAKKKDNLLRYIQALDIAIDSIEHEEKCNKAINDSAKAIAKMQRLCKKCHTNNEWVDVRDRLPSDEEEYLVTQQHSNFVMTGWYDQENKVWKDENYTELLGIIAWRPLPEPYKRKE